MSGSITFERAAHFYDQTRSFPPGVEAQAADLISRVGGFMPDSRVLEIGAARDGSRCRCQSTSQRLRVSIWRAR